jgi:hypothetical protein
VSVSFEDDLVKIVFASSSKGKIVVQKTLLLKDEEFDSFLKTAKLPNLTLICHFKKIYTNVIAVPPARPAYLKKIVQIEIQKRSPELSNFSFFYTVLKGKTAEEKGLGDVFYFAVDNSELSDIIERFNKYGKPVRYIYPDVLALSKFVQSTTEPGQKTILCVDASEKEKTLFIVQNGQLRFIRVTKSSGKDINDVDVDNINMTISYCRQVLKLNPEQIALINAIQKEETGPLKTIVPITTISYPANVSAPEETLRKFITPLSAIIFKQNLKKDSLLPQKYRMLNIQKSMTVYSIGLILLISFVGLSYLLINLIQVPSLKKMILAKRTTLTEIESVVSSYEKDSEKLQQLAPLISVINEVRSAPDIQKTLAAFTFLPMKNVNIKSIQINNKKDSVQVQISGSITAENFGEMYKTFQEIVNSFNQISGVAVNSKNIEIKDSSFQIDIESKIL